MTAVLRPLGITLQPIAGESLMSLISRHTEANHLPRSATILSIAGLDHRHIAHLPFADLTVASPLAAVLGTSVGEIESRMHVTEPVTASYETASYFGGSIRRVMLEARFRRVALTSLDVGEYHRPTWAIRALPFCPDTLEILQTRCWECGRSLGWGTCDGFGKCNRCKADLNRAAVRFVAEDLRNNCSAAARLVSPVKAERVAARGRFDNRFHEWDPCELFVAVVECGIAYSKLGESPTARNRKIASGDYSDVGPEDISIGVEFLSNFEESLASYAANSYEIFGSTSLWKGFGLLGKYLGSHRQQQFKTPLGSVLREAWPAAAGISQLPLRKWTGSTVVTVDRHSSVSMMEACKIVGAKCEQMRLLKGRSVTFLTQAYDRGGTALFDRLAIETLADVFDASMSNRDAGRALSLSKNVVDAFAHDGLLDFPDSVDEEIMSINYRRVTRASVQNLLTEVSRLHAVDEGVFLKHIVGDHGDPTAWLASTRAILSGELMGVGPLKAPATSFADLVVSPPAKPHLLAIIKASHPEAVLTGLQAASVLGTSGQFVGAAVSGELIKGRTEPRRLYIDATEVEAFRSRYILTAEIASLLSCRTHQAKSLLASVGVSPVAMFYKVNVYDRSQAALGQARIAQREVNQNDRPGASSESLSSTL